MLRKVRIGTRGSKLALWQTDYVVDQLQAQFPLTQFEVVVIKTQGDKILDVALSKVGDKGLFTKEIEAALLEKKVDMAVHSLKDLPSVIPEGLVLGAVLKRENPQDVLLSYQGYTLASLPPQARIGTSSLRRIAQLKAIRPDLNMVALRGNVETRIRKMKSENLDGIVLAYAGVARMGFLDEVTDYLAPETFLPAVGQGALGVEIRIGDQAIAELVQTIHNPTTGAEVVAERAFLRRLEGGCQVPIACMARAREGLLTLDGLVASLDGKTILRNQVTGPLDKGEELGCELANAVLDMGARSILEEFKCLGE